MGDRARGGCPRTPRPAPRPPPRTQAAGSGAPGMQPGGWWPEGGEAPGEESASEALEDWSDLLMRELSTVEAAQAPPPPAGAAPPDPAPALPPPSPSVGWTSAPLFAETSASVSSELLAWPVRPQQLSVREGLGGDWSARPGSTGDKRRLERMEAQSEASGSVPVSGSAASGEAGAEKVTERVQKLVDQNRRAQVGLRCVHSTENSQLGQSA